MAFKIHRLMPGSILVICLLQCKVADKTLPRIYEAEQGILDSLAVVRDSTASGGAFVRMEDKGRIAWRVETDRAGWHDLTFRYRSPQGEKEQIVDRNGYSFAVGFGWSKDWNLLTTQTCLQKGPNTIELRKGWGFIDVDDVQIAPSHVQPVIAPKRNVFYRQPPRDISLLLKRLGRRLASVTSNGKPLTFFLSDFPDFEDAVVVTISRESLIDLPDGGNAVKLGFDDGDSLLFRLTVANDRKPSKLTIVVPNISHGSSVLFVLPTGKTLLVDCGQGWARDAILIPLLDRSGIRKIDYFIITHYHEDHDGGDKGAKIKARYGVDHFYDNQSFSTGQILDLEGIRIRIMNSQEDGEDANTRSLSFKLEYNGFVYIHGGDTYASNQEKILKRFPGDIQGDVFFANHHFHGSLNPDYLKAVDPYLVLLQSEKAIYARSAYMVQFKGEIEKFWTKNGKRFIECLPALETGTAILRINGKDDWTYETDRDTQTAMILLPGKN